MDPSSSCIARSYRMSDTRPPMRSKSTGFSNAPRRNPVLFTPIRCIRAAASEVCETVQRKRRFGGQATFLWSVSPYCLIAYLVDKRRFIQCKIRGTRGSRQRKTSHSSQTFHTRQVLLAHENESTEGRCLGR